MKLSYYDLAEEYLKFDGTTGTTLLWKNKVMNKAVLPSIKIEEPSFLNATGFDMKMNCPLQYSQVGGSGSNYRRVKSCK